MAFEQPPLTASTATASHRPRRLTGSATGPPRSRAVCKRGARIRVQTLAKMVTLQHTLKKNRNIVGKTSFEQNLKGQGIKKQFTRIAVMGNWDGLLVEYSSGLINN